MAHWNLSRIAGNASFPAVGELRTSLHGHLHIIPATRDLNRLIVTSSANIHAQRVCAWRNAFERETSIWFRHQDMRRLGYEDLRVHRRMDVTVDIIESGISKGVLVGAVWRERDVELLLLSPRMLDVDVVQFFIAAAKLHRIA